MSAPRELEVLGAFLMICVGPNVLHQKPASWQYFDVKSFPAPLPELFFGSQMHAIPSPPPNCTVLFLDPHPSSHHHSSQMQASSSSSVLFVAVLASSSGFSAFHLRECGRWGA